jgi:uncharacterized protein
VILDTNALFLPVRRGFPLEAEIDRQLPGARPAVPSSALEELDRLAATLTADARTARQLADRFPVVRTEHAGDDGILDVAVRLQAVVVTADRALQRRLRDKGVSVLIPRDRHRLELRPGAAPSVAKRANRGRSRRSSPNP